VVLERLLTKASQVGTVNNKLYFHHYPQSCQYSYFSGKIMESYSKLIAIFSLTKFFTLKSFHPVPAPKYPVSPSTIMQAAAKVASNI
jgi:hypothetical protein